MTATALLLSGLADRLVPGTVQTAGSLVVLPLLLDPSVPAGLRAAGSAQTLTTALARGDAEILELDGGGSVPTLKVSNGGSLPLLLLDGEELVGAKQNRVLNTSVLVPAHAELEVPVSCVERGRWRYATRAFASRGRSMPARMKRDKMKRVSSSLELRRRYDADQGQIWRDVDQYAGTRGVRSVTGALGDVFDADREALGDARKRFHPERGQIGLAAWLDGELLGVEILFGADIFAESFGRIVHAYVSEAMLSPGSASRTEPDIAAVRSFLRAVGDAPEQASPSPGAGTDVRLNGPVGTAAVLLDEDGRLVHAAAFRLAA